MPAKDDDTGATFIPDQEDPLGAAVTEAVQRGPFALALRDLWTAVRMFTLFPGVILPLWTTNPQDEFYLGWGPNIFGLVLLTVASVFEVILIVLCIPMFLFLPGPVSTLLFIGGQAFLHLVCLPLQGPSKIWSKAPSDPEAIAKYKRVAGERWFFLNGCCVSGHNFQKNADVLAETFGRPIFAVHNRTYGVLGDLFECILQRSFNLFTEETRVCYEYVKAYCVDPDVTKVVLIAHSQGCIMASQILDQLYVDLPAGAVSKLEVYTFGNAASHFNNPLRKVAKTSASIDVRDMPSITNSTSNESTGIFSAPTNKEQNMSKLDGNSGKQPPTISEMLPERVVAHIEHYCNSGDMVTRWGALFSAKSILQNRFCGHIFINEGVTGHMLNQHYLSDMFPIHHKKAGAGHADGTSSEDKHDGIPFLDRVITLDTSTVTHRDSNAVHQLAVLKQDSSPVDHSDHSHTAHTSLVSEVHHFHSKAEHDNAFLKLGEGTELTSKDLSGAEGSRISVVKAHDLNEEYKGKTPLFGLNPQNDVPSTDVELVWYETVVGLYPYIGWPLKQFYENLEKLVDKAIARLVTKNEYLAEIKSIRGAEMICASAGASSAKLETQTQGYNKMIKYLEHLAMGGRRRVNDDLIASSVYNNRSAAFSELKAKVSETSQSNDWAKMKESCEALMDKHAEIATLWHLNLNHRRLYRGHLDADSEDDVDQDTNNKNYQLTRQVLGDAEKWRVPWQVGKNGQFGDNIQPLIEAFLCEALTGEKPESHDSDEDLATITTTTLIAEKTQREFKQFELPVQPSFISTMQKKLWAEVVCSIIKVPVSAMCVFIKALSPEFVWEDLGENFKEVILGSLNDRSNQAESCPFKKLLEMGSENKK